MKKKEIKDILKENGYKMIGASWYAGEKSEKSALFNAYDEHGMVYRFFVNWGGSKYDGKPYAVYQMLSNVCIHDTRSATNIFFKEV